MTSISFQDPELLLVLAAFHIVMHMTFHLKISLTISLILKL